MKRRAAEAEDGSARNGATTRNTHTSRDNFRRGPMPKKKTLFFVCVFYFILLCSVFIAPRLYQLLLVQYSTGKRVLVFYCLFLRINL